MVLYVENIIIDNFMVDFLIVSLLETTVKIKFKRWNKFFAIIIGVLSAVLLPLCSKYKLIMFTYKVATAFIMVLILKSYSSFLQYFKTLGIFVLYTFMFGGIIIGVLNLFGIEYTASGVLLYDAQIPMGIFLLLFVIAYWLIKKMIVVLSLQLKGNKFLHSIRLVDDGVMVDCVGLYDTGNRVNIDGQAVNIISLNSFFKLHKEYSINKFLFKNIDEGKLKNAKYLDIAGISKQGKYLTFEIDKLIINKEEINNAIVAVSYKNFKDFDCIINSSIKVGEND